MIGFVFVLKDDVNNIHGSRHILSNDALEQNNAKHSETIASAYDERKQNTKMRNKQVKKILEDVIQFNKIYFPKFIKNSDKIRDYLNAYDSTKWAVKETYCEMIGKPGMIQFPESNNININMMPFIMAASFEDSKLPLYTKGYWNIIDKCIKHDQTQLNKIGYLTIHESFVKKNNTQRRPGLHIENPGNIGGNNIKFLCGHGNTIKQDKIVWGKGYGVFGPKCPVVAGCQDGIYTANNVNDSTVMWNCKIMDIGNKSVIGKLGNIEHLRPYIENSNYYRNDYERVKILQNTLYWFTDRTPHECLKVKNDICRQFFRLVTHKVSIWYKEHNTSNPNGIIPDKKITRIVKGNKFN